MGIIGIDWCGDLEGTVQFSRCCSSTVGNPWFLEAKGAIQGKDFCIYMPPKCLVRQRLMSKMDFWSNYAIAFILSGYWVCLLSVGSGQSFGPLFISAFLLPLPGLSQTDGLETVGQVQLSLPALRNLTLISASSRSCCGVGGDDIVLQWHVICQCEQPGIRLMLLDLFCLLTQLFT